MNEMEIKRLNSLPADPRDHVSCDELGQQHQFTAWEGVAGRLERWCLACARRELASVHGTCRQCTPWVCGPDNVRGECERRSERDLSPSPQVGGPS